MQDIIFEREVKDGENLRYDSFLDLRLHFVGTFNFKQDSTPLVILKDGNPVAAVVKPDLDKGLDIQPGFSLAYFNKYVFTCLDKVGREGKSLTVVNIDNDPLAVVIPMEKYREIYPALTVGNQ